LVSTEVAVLPGSKLAWPPEKRSRVRIATHAAARASREPDAKTRWTRLPTDAGTLDAVRAMRPAVDDCAGSACWPRCTSRARMSGSIVPAASRFPHDSNSTFGENC